MPPASAPVGPKVRASSRPSPFARFAGHHRSFAEVHLRQIPPHRRPLTARRPRSPRATSPTRPSRPTSAPTSTSLDANRLPLPRPLHRSPPRACRARPRSPGRNRPAETRRGERKKCATASAPRSPDWARTVGEGADYTDNLPGQCLHPVGHWFEIRTSSKNGTLARLLAARQLRTLLVHNIDTLGASARSRPRRLVSIIERHARLRSDSRAASKITAAASLASTVACAPRRGPRPPARVRQVRPSLLQHEHVFDRYRPPARALRPDPRRARRCRPHRRRRPRDGRARPDLRHAQRR